MHFYLLAQLNYFEQLNFNSKISGEVFDKNKICVGIGWCVCVCENDTSENIPALAMRSSIVSIIFALKANKNKTLNKITGKIKRKKNTISIARNIKVRLVQSMSHTQLLIPMNM